MPFAGLGLGYIALACLFLAGCTQEKVSPNLDPGLVGTWRPVSLNGKSLAEDEAAESAYVIRRDGNATLSVRLPLSRYVVHQTLEASEGRMTIHNRISRKTRTVPYSIDGDRLTIGEGDARQEYVRRKR